MNLLLAFLFRDLAVEKSYRFNLFVKLLAIFSQVAIFYFLSRYIEKPEYFAFVLVGLVFSSFFQFWLNVFAENIRQEQFWGTLEALFSAPAEHVYVILSSSFGKFVFNIIGMATYVVLGAVVFGMVFRLNAALFLLILLLNVAAFAGLGLVSAGFITYFKRGDPASWFVALLVDLLSGVYFPVSVFPEKIRRVSEFLPTTAALDIWRNSLLGTGRVGFGDVALQALWGALLMAAGLVSINAAIRGVKKKGDLGNY
ncbi:MAG: ABC transporter permease [Endomicrobiales bacterium]|nr:ABC transporter permease [Endomicrobiales bacterium]